MHELISLAKENSFVVIGLLFVALFLQDRIDTESTAIRQEMSTYQLDTKEQIARIEILIERRFGEFETTLERRFGEFETSVERRFGEMGSRLTGIETSLEQIAEDDQN